MSARQRAAGPDRAVPLAWCYRCGCECGTFFRDGSHLDPLPATADVAAYDWADAHLTEADETAAAWLDALARHMAYRAFRVRRDRREVNRRR